MAKKTKTVYTQKPIVNKKGLVPKKSMKQPNFLKKK